MQAGVAMLDGTILERPLELEDWRQFILRMLPMMRMGFVQKRSVNPMIATLSSYDEYESGPAGTWTGVAIVTMSVVGGTPPYTAVWTEYSGVGIGTAFGAGSYSQQFTSNGISGVTCDGYYGVFVTDANTTTATNTLHVQHDHE